MLAIYDFDYAKIRATMPGKKIEQVLQLLKENGGVTVYNTPLQMVNSTTFELNFNTRTSGYVVGDNRCSQIISGLEFHRSTSVVQLVIAITDLWLKRPSCTAVGFWLDSNSGNVYVDAVDVIETLAEAMNTGAARGELAIWDIGMGREIRL